MNTSSLIKRSLLAAIGVTLYVTAVAWFLNNAAVFVGPKPGFLGSVFLILLFLVSACITGSLVLLKPTLMYLEGKKSDAIKMLTYSVVSLAVIAFLLLTFLVTR